MASSLTITPNIERKTARIVGIVSAGEKVAVRLVGCSALLTETLRIRVNCLGKMMAAFPLPDTEDAFTVDGEDLTFTLNLCTKQMLHRFRRLPEMECGFILDDTGADVRQMYFAEPHTILGWPQVPGFDVPIDLSGYADKIAALENDIAGMGERIDQHEAEVETALGGKVDKEAGKGLSHVDVTTETLGQFANAGVVSDHIGDTVRHITQNERTAWNNKADPGESSPKQDVIVQDGYLYIPDADEEGVWRRTQGKYDAEMGGVVLVNSDEAYVRRESDGVFVLKED